VAGSKQLVDLVVGAVGSGDEGRLDQPDDAPASSVSSLQCGDGTGFERDQLGIAPGRQQFRGEPGQKRQVANDQEIALMGLDPPTQPPDRIIWTDARRFHQTCFGLDAVTQKASGLDGPDAITMPDGLHANLLLLEESGYVSNFSNAGAGQRPLSILTPLLCLSMSDQIQLHEIP
jgi:hypothetical protein